MILHRRRKGPPLCTQRIWLSVRLAHSVALPGVLFLQRAGGFSALLNMTYFSSEIHVYLFAALKMLGHSILPVSDTTPNRGLHFSLWAIESALITSSDAWDG